MEEKEYHVTYYEKVGDRYSTGVNVKAESMLEAIAVFTKDYDKDAFSCVLKTNVMITKVCPNCEAQFN